MGGLRPTAVVFVCALAAAGCGQEASKPTAPAAPAAAAAVRTAPPSVTAKARPVADDAEAAQSFATDPSVKLTDNAPKPGAAGKAVDETTAEADLVSPGAPSDAQIARELEQMDAAVATDGSSGGSAHGSRLKSDGTAVVASDAPEVVKQIVAGANAIAKFPYVYGGGHGSFVDTAYDCSGSLSYALAAGGLLKAPKTSGDLSRTGERGKGEWVTIYANPGHTFMVVDGLRFDTSGRGGPRGTRWNASPRPTRGFRVTHPPGL